MRANLRSLVAKAYRVRQGRTFSSSSTTNPINYKGDISIYEYLFSRGLVSFIGFGVASCITGDSVSKFDEELKAIDKDAVDFLEKRGKLPPGSLDAMYKS
ncbi:uncharacterized protein LOC106351616 isoform X2 [Brassica napus]|uniref:uncharacterized protein LOC106351616 isoform X1 n=1 Tax=Brassica napus TaxID=3708 RepID=UPI002078D235|nr:uncharacterized protein LOC106351616 isoform X1 [Brassica napus]XP_048634705.1 uncharacterized protein LOC106351616 isoform X2 [Brassica napus]